MELPGLIRFFRACYEADNRRSTLWNIFHTGIEHRIVFTGREDALTGDFPRVPVTGAAEARQAAYLYRKEKEYLYCSLFIVGRIAPAGEERVPVCAPLLMHPAAFEENEYGHLFLRPDFGSRQWNYRLIDSLQQDQGEVSLYRALTGHIGTDAIGERQIGDIIALLRQYAPTLDCEALYHYPALLPERELAAAFRSARNEEDIPLRLVPASVAALVKKPGGTRGVLNELATLAGSTSFSAPLRMVLGERSADSPAPVQQLPQGRVPAVLSTAQERVLTSAAAHPLTLAIGPPGTGKSYTIACLALEHISRGDTVLIASKSDTAVDVVAEKIEQQLGVRGCIVRAGKKQYLRELKSHLQHLLNGMYTADSAAIREPARLRDSLTRLDLSLTKLEKKLDRRLEWETAAADILSGRRSGLTASLLTPWFRWKARHITPPAELTEQMEQLLSERSRAAVQSIEALQIQRRDQTLHRHRGKFSAFLQAIRARTGSRREELFNTIDFRLLFRAFPIWLVNLADIHDILPLEQDLFDLAIIDEATQCDLASSLPVLQRARRVVVTGDPQQLRHLSFLSQERQASLMARHGVNPQLQEHIDYREQSLLDVVSARIKSQEQVVFLNEHYRSTPAIISFSNAHFYDNALHIMTAVPGADREAAIILRRCAGHQTTTGDNPEESRALLADVLALVETEKQTGRCSSIGILSPFRAQADHLAEQLGTMLSMRDIERHDIITGTAYSFQGEERDVMFISFAVDAASHPARKRWLDKRDAFNVAVTRARKRQYVYTSLIPDSRSTSLVDTYLHYIADTTLAGITLPSGNRPAAAMVEALAEELRALGFTVQAPFTVAGIPLDLAAGRNGYGLAVECTGLPGRQPLLSTERYRMLRRAGLHCIPVAYSHWLTRPQECLDRFRRLCHSLP